MFNSAKMYKKWLFSFLAVIIMIILIFIMFNNMMISRFEEIAETSYINRTTGFVKNLNNELLQLQKIAFREQVAVQNVLIENATELNTEIKSSLYHMSSTLQNIQNANTLIDSIYIYYPKIDYIVGDIGPFKTRNYYYLMNKSYMKKDDDLDNIINNLDSLPQGYSIEDIYSNSENQLVYKSFRPYDYASQTEKLPSSVIYIIINKDEINNMIKYSNMNIGSNFIAIVDNNERIYAAGEMDFDNIEKLINHNDIYVINQSTNIDSIKLIGAIENKILLEDRNLMNTYSYIMLAICFLVGLIMAIYFSTNNTKPLRLIVDKIQTENTSNKNEYDIIRHAIEDMIDKNKKIIERNEIRLERLHEEFVRNIISRRVNSGLEFNELLQYYELDMNYSYFTFLKIEQQYIHSNLKNELENHVTDNLNDIMIKVTVYKGNTVIFVNHEEKEVINRLINSIQMHYTINETDITVSDTIDHFTGIYALYKNIDKKIDVSPKTKGQGVAENIKLIIDNNFKNPSLGLILIAEQLNLSTSYISRVFKKEYDIGIAEYINNIRIEKAKELILLNRMTVKEIAESVGFSSDIHFIRVFKKQENITPGKYKVD